ncbi:uncharacterized protein LOC110723835 [Chenopodium quinoa]|uniref:uncharacterized protein LOC110723835 n=1 Tax=Chenopodium quinoa TaxID=63459 RepID=UPI000B7994A4|nr:uncharacterized protein LOC110723835 [Chenopodium quinoa]
MNLSDICKENLHNGGKKASVKNAGSKKISGKCATCGDEFQDDNLFIPHVNRCIKIHPDAKDKEVVSGRPSGFQFRFPTHWSWRLWSQVPSVMAWQLKLDSDSSWRTYSNGTFSTKQ